MKKILITGASGFVGNNLLRYCTTHALEPVSVSLRNELPSALPEGIDAVVHLAGKAHDLKDVSNPSEYFTVNAGLTKKLFNLFLLSDSSIFIFLSSVKASADIVDGELTEEDVPNPVTPYGQSKLEAETFLLSQTLPAGKRLYILRPCMIHGPGNKGNLNLLYNLVSKGIPYPLAAFENKRSFLSVANLCFVIHQLINRNDILPGIYNVADKTPLSTNEVMKIMGEELSGKIRLIKINRSLIKGIARIGDMIPFPLNTQKLKKLTENYIVNTGKLVNALQAPLPVQSDEGLRVSIRSFAGDSKAV